MSFYGLGNWVRSVKLARFCKQKTVSRKPAFPIHWCICRAIIPPSTSVADKYSQKYVYVRIFELLQARQSALTPTWLLIGEHHHDSVMTKCEWTKANYRFWHVFTRLSGVFLQCESNKPFIVLGAYVLCEQDWKMPHYHMQNILFCDNVWENWICTLCALQLIL